MIATLAFTLSLGLFAQPDAKIANGVYWTEFWLTLLSNLLY